MIDLRKVAGAFFLLTLLFPLLLVSGTSATLVPFLTKHTVDGNFDGAHDVHTADIDKDGDLDIVGAGYEAGEIAWWENTAGDGLAWTKRVVEADFWSTDSVVAADVDGDGDMDILATAFYSYDIVWWANNGDGTSWTKHVLNGEFAGAYAVHAADVNADGHMDVLGAAAILGDITWWQNVDGSGTNWTERIIDGDFADTASVYAADVDNDGHVDVLGAAPGDDDIAWWENTDGTGTTWTEHLVDGDFDSAYSVVAGDVDGDGDMDVLGAAYNAHEIAWWENTDELGTTWSKHLVDGAFTRAFDVQAADMDSDGDLDILGAAIADDEITWWENSTGDGTAWVEHVVDGAFDGPYSVYAGDVDGDGDLDVLGTARFADELAWWENETASVTPTATASATSTPTATATPSATPSPSASCVAPPAGMVAWWMLDEASGSSAADIVGGNGGTHVNGPTIVAGMVDRALEFDGVDDYVEVPDAPDLDFGEGDFSIDAWIRTDSSDSYEVFIDKQSATPVGYEFLLYNGRLMFQLADTSGWSSYYNPSSDLLNDGAWHFVAVAVDRDGESKLYADGQLIHTFNPAKRSGSVSNDVDLWIGKHHANTAFPDELWFDGQIDEVEFFKRVLSPGEVEAIYDAGSNGKCKSAIHGVKFNDLNQNGAKDSGEPTLPNWTITLADSQGTILTTTTDVDGRYEFKPLSAGAYAVSEVQQEGWTQTLPLSATYGVALEIGQIVEDLDFGNSTTTCLPLPNNMVGWWPLDESGSTTAADIVGGHNGTHLNNPTPIPGMVDVALRFDGVDDYVEVPDHSDLNFGTGDFSIDAWIRTDSDDNYQVLLDKRNFARIGYKLFLYNGRLMFELADSSGWSTYYNPNSKKLNDGDWHLVAVTVDRDGNGQLYADGDVIHTFYPGKRPGSINNTANLWIGKHHVNKGLNRELWFEGDIDEVEIFNRALEADEIKAIYEAGSLGKCKCDAPSFSYTTEEDFTNGLTGVSTPFLFNLDAGPSDASSSTVLPSDHLQLKPPPLSPFPFVWVAASRRGTMVRIDVNTGDVLGEYRTAPDGMGKSPSRTTVDQNGNVWVGNRNESSSSGGRAKGSVARVGLVIGGTRVDASGNSDANGQYLAPPFQYNTCQDRDHDGLIKTSTGLANILHWSNAGSDDTHGGVSTAEDECIINYTRVTGTGTRSVAVDANNDVWVGGIGNREHEKLSGVTGLPIADSQINYNCGGYGALVDKNGVLWSARGLLRYEPSTKTGLCLGDSMGNYGLGIDPNTGHIWHSSAGGTSKLYEIDPVTKLELNSYPQPFGVAQGVVVDANSHVWVAEASGNEVAHYAPDTSNPGTHLLVGTVTGFASTTGLALDGNGKIWASERNSSATRGAARIDPNAGPIGTGGYDIGQIDLTVGLGSGANPYNYSDMTGIVAINNPPQGFWQVTEDSGKENARWCELCWNLESTGVYTSQIKVEIRAANSLSELMSATWVEVENCADLSELNITGQYIEIRATVIQRDPEVAPILTDLTVKACCGTPDLGDAPDSSNHFATSMTTYPANITANFPTVYDDPADIAGPKHWNKKDDAWLGAQISPEDEADQGGANNIKPLTNEADLDDHDDGVDLNTLQLPNCELTQFQYDVTVAPSTPLGDQERYVNVWFDFDRDGEWNDRVDCPNAVVDEWAVQNQVINVGAGQHTLSTPQFMATNPPNPEQPIWMRITLSDQPAAAPEDGRGPADGYKYGETEDYRLVSNQEADLSIEKTHTDTFTIGQTASYVVTVENKGPASTTAFTITDPLPINLTFLSASGAGWACSPTPATAPHTVNCGYSGPPIPSGGTTQVVMTVSVGGYEGQEAVENCATVHSENDPQPNNNTSCDPTEIAWPDQVPDLTLTKAHLGGAVAPGRLLTFTISVENLGDGDTIGQITVDDTMTPYVELVSSYGSGEGSAGIDDSWECRQTTTDEVECANSQTLPPGKNSVIYLVVRVNDDAPLSITNCAQVDSPVDADFDNNRDCDTVPINDPSGSVQGMKFDDLDGDGVKDPNEPGLSGWEINFTDASGNVFTTTTDANGNYSLSSLAAGTYIVSEVQQAGWIQTYPSAPGTHTVKLAADQVVEGIDFGNASATGADFGDAPDSTSHFDTDMTTYSAMPMPANFPTAYDESGYPSPVGPKHNRPKADAWLGADVSVEANADQGPDSDGQTNIDPSTDSADRDEYDDGVHLDTIALPHCGSTTFEYDATVVGGAGTRTLNVWIDYNKDGDFDDSVSCTPIPYSRTMTNTMAAPLPLFISEWAIQNHPVDLSNGYHSNLTTPSFFAKQPQSTSGPISWPGMELWRTWMRVTLTGENDPQPPRPPQPCPGGGIFIFGSCPADGRGPVGGYEHGETEDYLVKHYWRPIRIDATGWTTGTFTQTNGFADNVIVSPGSVTEPMTMTFNPVRSESLLGSQLALRRFEFNAFSGEESESASDFTFQRPVTLTLHYTDTEVGGGNRLAVPEVEGRRSSEEELQLRRYDPEEGDWVDAACAPVVRHSDENKLEVPICKTGEFVLAGPVTTGVAIFAPAVANQTVGEQVQLPIAVEPYTSSLDLASIEFTLTYDPNVMEITGASQEDTLSQGWTVTTDTTAAGRINVVINGTGPLPDDGGTLINLTANLTSNAGANTPLIFSEAVLNQGDLPLYTQSGFLAIQNRLYLPLLTR
ncbi:MAG: LamG-like jellyroll fold domain-containing protein [Ardenticatenaceae bacterium]